MRPRFIWRALLERASASVTGEMRPASVISHVDMTRLPSSIPFLPLLFGLFLSIAYSRDSQIHGWMGEWMQSLLLIFWFLLLWCKKNPKRVHQEKLSLKKEYRRNVTFLKVFQRRRDVQSKMCPHLYLDVPALDICRYLLPFRLLVMLKLEARSICRKRAWLLYSICCLTCERSLVLNTLGEPECKYTDLRHLWAV